MNLEDFSNNPAILDTCHYYHTVTSAITPVQDPFLVFILEEVWAGLLSRETKIPFNSTKEYHEDIAHWQTCSVRVRRTHRGGRRESERK